jgi:hypothetical protein
MNEPKQKLMEVLGKEGCYIDCIVHLGEGLLHESLDDVQVFLRALEEQQVKQNCLVLDAAGLLSDLTGVQWTKRNESASYQAKPGELEIQRWEHKSGSGTSVHFITQDYDPYGDSRTVREGVLASKRIFSRA